MAERKLVEQMKNSPLRERFAVHKAVQVPTIREQVTLSTDQVLAALRRTYPELGLPDDVVIEDITDGRVRYLQTLEPDPLMVVYWNREPEPAEHEKLQKKEKADKAKGRCRECCAVRSRVHQPRCPLKTAKNPKVLKKDCYK